MGCMGQYAQKDLLVSLFGWSIREVRVFFCCVVLCCVGLVWFMRRVMLRCVMWRLLAYSRLLRVRRLTRVRRVSKIRRMCMLIGTSSVSGM